MRLKNYSRRRKMQTGGKVPPWWKNPIDFFTNTKGETISSKWRPPAPKQLPGGNTKLPAIRPNNLPSQGLKTITRNSLGRTLAGPLAVGVPAGIALGEAYAGEEMGLTDYVTGKEGDSAGGRLVKAKRGLNEARANKFSADEGLAMDQMTWGDNEFTKKMFNPFYRNGNSPDRPSAPINTVDDTPIEDPINVDIESGRGKGLYDNVGKTSSSDLNSMAKRDVGSLSEGNNLNTELQKVDTPASSGMDWKGVGQTALQFLPDVINFATGALSKDKTPQATQVDRSSLSKMPSKYNVNPMLRSNAKTYRAILSDPNATMNQKLAAQVMKQNADQQVYAEKENKEALMEADKAKMEMSLDRQQSQYDSQERQDRMMSDANRGVAGNFARQSLANMSTKALQLMREKNMKNMDEKTLRAALAPYDDKIKNEILMEMGLA